MVPWVLLGWRSFRTSPSCTVLALRAHAWTKHSCIARDIRWKPGLVSACRGVCGTLEYVAEAVSLVA